MFNSFVFSRSVYRKNKSGKRSTCSIERIDLGLVGIYEDIPKTKTYQLLLNVKIFLGGDRLIVKNKNKTNEVTAKRLSGIRGCQKIVCLQCKAKVLYIGIVALMIRNRNTDAVFQKRRTRIAVLYTIGDGNKNIPINP